MMTGVSQPYISKLLNGNHRELSLRCRKNIYSWYLNCRRHPEKLATFVQDPSSRLETNTEGELVPQRRERYVFRPMLIKILEAYFLLRGSQLMPKEVVTPQVIANWFANKRKEMRRKSNDEISMMPICSGLQQLPTCGTPTSPGSQSTTFSPTNAPSNQQIINQNYSECVAMDQSEGVVGEDKSSPAFPPSPISPNLSSGPEVAETNGTTEEQANNTNFLYNHLNKSLMENNKVGESKLLEDFLDRNRPSLFLDSHFPLPPNFNGGAKDSVTAVSTANILLNTPQLSLFDLASPNNDINRNWTSAASQELALLFSAVNKMELMIIQESKKRRNKMLLRFLPLYRFDGRIVF
uniref:POU-specific atypical domain-containing protein n=1 Tax=Ditylenchus dipsaci TaxID=166011 RepID=A0A915ERG4_9BILA